VHSNVRGIKPGSPEYQELDLTTMLLEPSYHVVIKVAIKSLKCKERHCAFENPKFALRRNIKKLADFRTCALQHDMPTFDDL
jgi:hypothetical protein